MMDMELENLHLKRQLLEAQSQILAMQHTQIVEKIKALEAQMAKASTEEVRDR